VHTFRTKIATVCPEAFDGPRLHVLAPGDLARLPRLLARRRCDCSARDHGTRVSLARVHDGVLHARANSSSAPPAFPCGIKLGNAIWGNLLHHAAAITPDGSGALLRSSSRGGSRDPSQST